MSRDKESPDFIEIAGTLFVVGVPSACQYLNEKIVTRCSTASREFLKTLSEEGEGATSERTMKDWVNTGKVATVNPSTRAALIEQGLYKERRGKPAIIDVASLDCFVNSWCPQNEQGSSYIFLGEEEASRVTGYAGRTLSEQNAQGAPVFQIGQFKGRNVASYTAWDLNRKK